MRNLRVLHSTIEILTSEYIVGISKLPCLESLVIRPSTREFWFEEPAPKGSFQNLRKFSLERAPVELFEDIWKVQIFECLTSLKLDFVTVHPTPEQTRVWSEFLVSSICNDCPGLVDLSIDFDFDQNTDVYVELLPDEIILPMRKIPLEKLDLRSAEFCNNAIEGYLVIPSAWSHLKTLCLVDVGVTAIDLSWFSELPNLETLIVQLVLSTPGPPDPQLVRKTINTRFKVLNSWSHRVNIRGDVHEIARWLLSLWPGLDRVEWTKGEEKKPDPIAGALNGAIGLLRRLNETKTRLSREEYGSRALSLFSEGL
ncbi:hypothetical protein RhiJN_11320 [Ceratobasidium sp. AG-Ba]|nr:hypothetical protein RhiJN_11320 [Ceratobasidium sp. AG-Ba]